MITTVPMSWGPIVHFPTSAWSTISSRALGSDALADRILRDNPARLYEF